jgi:hypothetical protein
MAKYILLDALVAKIRKYINNAEVYLKYHHNRNDKSVYAFEQEKLAMCELLSSLDTLEVKEVDLEKELGKYLDSNDIEFSHQIKLFEFAEHFFELGMSVSNKVKSRII